jgi:hypothetical protein
VALVFSWFQDGESQDIKGPMRVPTEKDSIDTDEERAFQGVIASLRLTVQTWDLALHDAAS